MEFRTFNKHLNKSIRTNLKPVTTHTRSTACCQKSNSPFPSIPSPSIAAIHHGHPRPTHHHNHLQAIATSPATITNTDDAASCRHDVTYVLVLVF